ncbi:MAG: hypothetical protein ACRENE_07155 [Polyangiaceae bacterium]
MTDPAGIPALIDAIRHLHDCGAKHVETVHVREVAPTGEVAWEGDVEVFDLMGHAKVKRAYAWSEATTGTKRRFFAVLRVPGVETPVAAVRASVLQDVNWPLLRAVAWRSRSRRDGAHGRVRGVGPRSGSTAAAGTYGRRSLYPARSLLLRPSCFAGSS